jgi:hypothetical protein
MSISSKRHLLGTAFAVLLALPAFADTTSQISPGTTAVSNGSQSKVFLTPSS